MAALPALNPIYNTNVAGIAHVPVRTALTNLHTDIRDRIDRERTFMIHIKARLNLILHGIQGCVAHAAAVVAAPGGYTAADLDAVAHDIDDIRNELTTIQPFENDAGRDREVGALIDPLKAYAPHLRTQLTPGPNVMPGNIPRRPALLNPGQNMYGGWTPNKKTKRRRKNRTYYKL